MILECGDLERALRTPELMPDMRAHAERCPSCAAELHLWESISNTAPALREEWESPYLWSRIHANLAAESAPRAPRLNLFRWALASAALLVLATLTLQPWKLGRPANRELMTESALADVQQAEKAYAQSIERLSALATPKLDGSSSPIAAAYREKLVLLDAGIADLKRAIELNRFNTYLQAELASLYRQKQQTLQEWLQDANRN